MCRFVAYLGSEVLLEDILVKPINSIIMQSLHARESTIPTNGDGFGLGWYAPELSDEPALFTSVSPAWNDRNLLNLTAKIKSPCFFAHVRAASAGGVTNYNCHPFVFGKWMLMHNGNISDFITVKRHLRHLLDDDIYNWIQGETDSEHIFALFLQLAKGKDLNQLSVLTDIMQATLATINELVEHYGQENESYYNLCLTDGQRLIASRYCTEKNAMPESLHVFTGENLHEYIDIPHPIYKAVLISSEKLTNFNTNWQDVPANHLLIIDNDYRIEFQAL
ncbi:Amidohydrolase EgtC [Legionella massiliensis]|uniref:Amidohydrolase EgtC n=1 Tax=Legionella massiliensis TaxID=1034943 RepID=A0A078KXX2_9GAMM|nr:class II glutamine amidotransferase [Legionella massiliensis]CDZ77872.1 Amidohydrolase EgtC [Legionella massiliensis]CEE13610.1 Amidohydrolase EgtC [Legionella massiliensis]